MVEFAGCTSEKTTIPVITWVFQPFGIPEDYKSDNGPPLTVLKYRKYVQEEGFKHRKVTLEWSEANGDVERHMQRIKKTATATLQLLLYQLTNEIAHQGFWIYSWLKTITWFWRWLSNRLSRRHPDNHFQSRYVPPGFKPFSYHELCNIVPVSLQNFFDAIYQKRRRVLHHGF